MSSPMSLATMLAASTLLLVGLPPPAAAQHSLPDFTTLAADNSPAVVNISTTQRKAAKGARSIPEGSGDA